MKRRLHIHSQSPYGNASIGMSLRLLQTKDALLFRGDAVYAAVRFSEANRMLTHTTRDMYVLREDAEERGVAHRINENMRLINYREFVRLCVDYDESLSWR